LILGIIGGVLLLSGGIGIVLKLLEGTVNLDSHTLLLAVLGVVTIVSSGLIWTGRYVPGGAINIALGILVLVYGEVQQGLLVLISGILGIIAPKIED
jgi:hypothetical protein